MRLDEAGNEAELIYPRLRAAPPPARPEPAPSLFAPAPGSLQPIALRPPIPVIRPSSANEDVLPERALTTTAAAAADPETARREGVALHALLQHLPRFGPADRAATARRALRSLLPDAPERHEALAARALSILTRPELATIFGLDSRAEVPFLTEAFRKGELVRLAGRIDRLVVRPGEVLVVDFKSDANPPADPAGVPPAYRTQIGLYALVATQLFPGLSVRGAILWTSLESLLELPREALVDAASGFTMR